jgi:polysaccharide biosynthesis transport protein
MTDEIPGNSLLGGLLEKWQRRKFLIVSCALLVFSAAAGYVLAMPSLYKSTTTMLFGQENISESLVRENVSNELELRLGLVTQAVLSRDQLQEVIDAFDLYADLRMEATAEAVIRRIRQDIDIEQTAATQPQWGQNSAYTVSISYQAWNPQLAADVTNEIAARFQAENERLHIGQAARTTEFIKAQLEDARARFSAEEQRVNEFRDAHMGQLPEQEAINLATLERLNSTLRQQAEKETQLVARRNDLLFGVNGQTPATGAAGLTGGMRLTRLEQELAELKQDHTDSYPGVIRLEQDIAQLKLELEDEKNTRPASGARPQTGSPAAIDQELATLRREQAATKASIQELVDRIADMPRTEQELTHLAYEHDAAREAYLSLQKLYQEARLAESLVIQQNRQFKILEMAIPPDYPEAPNQASLLVMSLMLAMGLAGGAGLLAEQLDKSFHSSAALRQLTTIPVLAVVPNIRTTADRARSLTKTLLISALLIVGIVALNSWSNYAGSNAHQVVWSLAE